MTLINMIIRMRYAVGQQMSAAEDVVGVAALPDSPPVLSGDVWSFTTTYISPVESELMNRRPCRSKAIPTGRKQPRGQFELSALTTTSLAAVLLSGAATGSPFAKGMTESL